MCVYVSCTHTHTRHLHSCKAFAINLCAPCRHRHTDHKSLSHTSKAASIRRLAQTKILIRKTNEHYHFFGALSPAASMRTCTWAERHLPKGAARKEEAAERVHISLSVWHGQYLLQGARAGCRILEHGVQPITGTPWLVFRRNAHI